MSITTARAYVGLFDPFRLTISRQLAGLKKTDLAKRVGVSPAAITQYENGANGGSKPSPAMLVQLALTLGQSIEFFAQDGRRSSSIDHGHAFFRSLRSTKQIDRDKAEARTFLASEIVAELRHRVKFPDLNIPENLHVGEDADRELIESRAEQLRTYWKMTPGPVPNMVRLLEANGIIVIRCDSESREVDAFSRRFVKQPLVVLTADKALDRQRFDAAHELGHLVLHIEEESGNRVLEEQANMFAAAFLMPQSLIKNDLPSRLDWPVFRRLKEIWGVSVQALLRRAKDLGRMSEATYRRAMMTLSQMNERANERSFPLQGAERAILLRKAVEVLDNKGFTVQDLARETRLPEAFVKETVYDQEENLPVLALSV
jgi:Zn-dependent peptidase ImmA (M78 family)/transcriptional regulator with XRE-family HTH domain